LNFGRGKNEIGYEAICGNIITFMVGLSEQFPNSCLRRRNWFLCSNSFWHHITFAGALWNRVKVQLVNAMVRDQHCSPHWKHSELFFDKKALIPALQQLLTACSRPAS